jgi:hypothetical protein
VHIPLGLLAAPWLIGDPIFCAFMYPACLIFCAMIYLVIFRPFYARPAMSHTEMREKLLELRKVGPCPVNRPESGGPLSIDPLQIKQYDDMIKKLEEEGESTVCVHIATHEIGTQLVGNRKNPQVAHISK